MVHHSCSSFPPPSVWPPFDHPVNLLNFQLPIFRTCLWFSIPTQRSRQKILFMPRRVMAAMILDSTESSRHLMRKLREQGGQDNVEALIGGRKEASAVAQRCIHSTKRLLHFLFEVHDQGVITNAQCMLELYIQRAKRQYSLFLVSTSISSVDYQKLGCTCLVQRKGHRNTIENKGPVFLIYDSECSRKSRGWSNLGSLTRIQVIVH